MAQFQVFMVGGTQAPLVELPAADVDDLAKMALNSRFLRGEIIDFVDHDGICTNRPALIPVGRIQLIVEG